MLRRAAFSPNIKERADCSAALFTADGELLVQAEHIPVHLGSMPASVRAAIDAFGDTLRPGRPGHPQRPVRRRHPPQRHHPRRPVLRRRPARRAGPPTGPTTPTSAAWRPGSIPADATEIYQEGLRIPPVLLTADVEAMLLRQLPHARRAPRRPRRPGRRQRRRRRAAGRARRRAARRGHRLRRAPHAGRAGRPARRHVVVRGRARLVRPRARPAAPGRGSSSPSPSPATRSRSTSPAPTPSGRATSTPSRRSPSARSSFALRSATDPTIPANGGALRPVTVIAPPGIDRGGPPAGGGRRRQRRGQPAGRRRLPRRPRRRPLPDRVGAASQGTMNNVAHRRRRLGVLRDHRRRPGRPPGRAGMSGVHTGMTNTQNTPIEALERAFPMRVRRYRLRRGSGGAGQLRRAARASSATSRCSRTCTVSLITERRQSPPVGPGGRRAGRGRARTGCCRAATRRGPSGCPTSARSASRPATCCGCSRRAAGWGLTRD